MMRPGAAIVGLLLAACGGTGSAPPAGGPSGPINVFAAASLTDAMKAIGPGFQREHPGTSLRFNFAGSTALVTQIVQGAPADVLASADQPNMQKAIDAGATSGTIRSFAGNRLQIVVAAGNPKAVRGLADLSAPSLVVVLCAPAVPCGGYAAQALARAGVKLTPRSQEQDVKGVVTKVALHEADAGIVYVTDVRSGGAQVQGVDIPEGSNVVVTYPVAAIRGGPNPAGGRAFADYLLTPAAQSVLASYGFTQP